MKRPLFSISKAAVYLASGLLVLCLAAAAVAGGLEDARRRGRLLAGVKTDFPPFGYRDSAGAIQGFDADLARYLGRALFADETGVELVPVTSGGRIPFLYSDFIDVIVATMTITEDRKRVLEFTIPYFISGSMLVAPKQSSIRGLQDLAKRKVAVLEGSVQQQDLPQIAPKTVIVPYPTMGEALQALRGGQVDALCQDDVAVLALVAKDSELKTAGKAFLPRPYAMAVRKGDLKFRDWLDAQLEKMKADGTLQALRRKYFGEKEAVLMQFE